MPRKYRKVPLNHGQRRTCQPNNCICGARAEPVQANALIFVMCLQCERRGEAITGRGSNTEKLAILAWNEMQGK